MVEQGHVIASDWATRREPSTTYLAPRTRLASSPQYLVYPKMPPPTASLKPSPAAVVNAKADKEKEKTGKSSKPDQSAYIKEQDELNKEIEGVKAQLVGARLKQGPSITLIVFECSFSLLRQPRFSLSPLAPHPQNDVRSKLSLLHAPQSETDRRSVIKAELDALQAQQRDAKGDRSKLFDQLKRTQDSIAGKIKDVNAQRGKLPVKNRDEAEQRIRWV